ncbi:MAG: murein biosynthesis integral membrane protein MurJ [Pseudomonadales bacterium]
MSTSTEPAARQNNVAAQGSVVAGMTLLSRISGFARDMVLSYFFGAGAAADAFFVAFRIPNFFRRLFAEGAFAQAFVPVLARYRDESPSTYLAFVAAVAGNLALAVWAVVLLGVVFAPALVVVFAPGFWDAPDQFDIATGMLRVTFPYLGFISLTAFAAALLNSHGRYAIPAFTPVLLNLSLIGAMLFATGAFEEPVYALAWGVFVAGLAQLAFQIPSLVRLGLLVVPRPSLSHPGVRQVGRLLLPAMFAASVSQINTLIDTMLASTLTTGSISWLYYADRLLELPIGLVAVALGTVLLPNLSRLASSGDREGFTATLEWGLRMGALLGMPAAVALYVLALPLVATLFLRGAMTPLDALMASLAVQAFALALVPLVMVKVVAPAYFSREDTATPFRFAVVAVSTNVALNLALFSWFGHVGLAFATAAAAWVHAWLLVRGLLRPAHPGLIALSPSRQLLVSLARSAAAAVAMGIGLWWWLPEPAAWIEAASWTRAGWITLCVAAGGAGYLLLIVLLGERPGRLLHRA